MPAPQLLILRSKRRARRSPRPAYIPARYQSSANAYEHSRSAPVATALLITSALWLAGSAAVFAAVRNGWIPQLRPLKQGVHSIQLSASLANQPNFEPPPVTQILTQPRPAEVRAQSLAAGKLVIESRSRSLLGKKIPRGVEEVIGAIESAAHDPPFPIASNRVSRRAAIERQPESARSTIRPLAKRSAAQPKQVASASVAPSKRSRGVRSRSPQLVHNPQPDFPPRLLASETEGRVIVTAAVRGDGRVAGVKLFRSSGFREFDEAALAAVSRWRFNSDKQVDANSTMNVNVPLSFRVER